MIAETSTATTELIVQTDSGRTPTQPTYYSMSSPSKVCQPWAVKLAGESKRQGLPDEKIRQKLVLEGLEPEFINPILDGTCTLKSPSMLGSPQDEGFEPVVWPSSPQRLSAR